MLIEKISVSSNLNIFASTNLHICFRSQEQLNVEKMSDLMARKRRQLRNRKDQLRRIQDDGWADLYVASNDN